MRPEPRSSELEQQMEAMTIMVGKRPLVIYVLFLECIQWLGPWTNIICGL